MLDTVRNHALAFMLFIIPALLFVALAVTVTSEALAQEQGGQQPAAQDNPQQPQQPPPSQPSQPSQGQGGQPPPQDKGLDVDIDIHEEPVWYGQWWVWALGIAVFLIVIIALTNRGRSA
jgi:hypothetical protein